MRPSRFPHGYADEYGMPLPLPNSPPLRQQGGYRGKGTSRLIMGGDHKMEGGGKGSSCPLDKRTDAERIQQARDLYHQE